MKFSISEGDLKKYLFKYFGSLSRYPDHYLPMIFEKYVSETKHLAYLCPLCITSVFYTEDTYWHFTEDFSLDHFPPKNVGGRKKIMICKKCNNTAGHEYENSLREKVIQEGYNRKVPNIEVPAKTTMDNVKGWMHGAISVADNGATYFRLAEVNKNRVPKLTEHQDKTNNDGKGFQLNIKINPIDKTKVTKALLKTAYLYCFDYWGYEFVFSATGELFRNVLSDKVTFPIDTPTLWYDNKADIHQGIDIPVGLVYIEKPKEIASMFVNVPLYIKEFDYGCIVPIQIPHPGDDGFKDVIRVQQSFYDNPSQVINIKPIGFEFSMNYPTPYSRAWEEILKLVNS